MKQKNIENIHLPFQNGREKISLSAIFGAKLEKKITFPKELAHNRYISIAEMILTIFIPGRCGFPPHINYKTPCPSNIISHALFHHYQSCETATRSCKSDSLSIKTQIHSHNRENSLNHYSTISVFSAFSVFSVFSPLQLPVSRKALWSNFRSVLSSFRCRRKARDQSAHLSGWSGSLQN